MNFSFRDSDVAGQMNERRTNSATDFGFPLATWCRTVIAAFIATFAISSNSAEISGVILSVKDGDTVTFSRGADVIRVRLLDIDAPEAMQSFGSESAVSLRELCLFKQVILRSKGKDRFGRVLAQVSCSGVDANAEQVRRGMAWVFEKYAHRDSPLFGIQAVARAESRGLWADPAPVAPWIWRRAQR